MTRQTAILSLESVYILNYGYHSQQSTQDYVTRLFKKMLFFNIIARLLTAIHIIKQLTDDGLWNRDVETKTVLHILLLWLKIFTEFKVL